MQTSQQKLMNYAKSVSDLIETLEQNQNTMSPYFEKIKNAINADKVTALSADDVKETKKVFKKGVENYNKAFDKLSNVEAPAKLMGVAHTLTNDLRKYVNACEEMRDSLTDDGKISVDEFLNAEKVQDQENRNMSKQITKISLAVQ